jgi:putative molybdopterin biosynthesis protein
VSVYLEDIPLVEARSRFEHAIREAKLWRVLGTESIPLTEAALGRVLAESIWAKQSSPHYHASAMDGFALQAAATAGAQPSRPIGMSITIRPGGSDIAAAEYVDTGDPLPGWANAVVPIENVELLDEVGNLATSRRTATTIRLRSSLTPWANVRPLGEDIVATQLVIAAGEVLRPVDLGAIAAAGFDHVMVARKPRVAIIPTGSELVPIGAHLEKGQILEYNSLIIAAQVASMGGLATRYPITEDSLGRISQIVREAALSHDLVLLNAGSSAGSEDFSLAAIQGLGVVLVHGVAVRPGHPVILGMLDAGPNVPAPRGARVSAQAEQDSVDLRAPTPVIGVPGFPVSASLTVDIFVEPIIAKWLGRPSRVPSTETAALTRKVTSPPGDADYLRVRLGRVGDRLLAAPLSRAAGAITSLVQADGIVVVSPGVQGMVAGAEVRVQLLRSPAELDSTIFCIGSHDLALDLMAQYLAPEGRRLISSNVGSQGGLVALSEGQAHMAGSHLLDPATGEYNVSYVRRYLSGVRVRIVGLVWRQQGLAVAPGNPKGIESLADLARGDVLFVNRQRGAGTRVLLDYHLSRLSILPTAIHGYNQEEFTHLGVAAAVAGGRADCGLLIAAAAHALELDFVPMFKERYDLIIPMEHAVSGLMDPLWALLTRTDFQEAVSRLPGYEISVMGKVILEDK